MIVRVYYKEHEFGMAFFRDISGCPSEKAARSVVKRLWPHRDVVGSRIIPTSKELALPTENAT